mmetsp:Transcript_147232/g.274255  ORF Transcript_147232/g.274255 Transcript_147232/m.274255 type:complete len:205 (+) Transcript_147232:55-669(+)
MARLPAIPTANYNACGDGRDLFIFFDATKRGGKTGEQEVMRFLPKPSSRPPNKRRAHGVSTKGPGEHHEQLWNLSGSSPRYVEQQKTRHLENDTRDIRHVLARSMDYPILSPRVDPAVHSNVPFRRTAGLAASSAPPAVTLDLPGAVSSADQHAQWTARSARSEAAESAADLEECPWDLKKTPHLKLEAHCGTSRTHWGGFWAS